MVETEGLEKHSDQIITDFLYIMEVPIPIGLIPRAGFSLSAGSRLKNRLLGGLSRLLFGEIE